MEKIIESRFIPGDQLLVTRLSGILNEEDIVAWKASLEAALATVPDNGSFKILVNLHGFQAENYEVHKKYRVIIPLLLAGYGYRIGYLDMFPEADVVLRNTRGIRCLAMANVHHDNTKMEDYSRRFSGPAEAYFTVPGDALDWIQHL